MSNRDHPGEVETEGQGNPIIVDLDGSLLRTDLLHESLVALLRSNPLHVFSLLFWLTKGIAYMKRRIAERVVLDVSELPVNEPVVAFLAEEHQHGRRLVLATASDALLARPVGEGFGFFSLIIANNGTTNLKGRRKLEEIHSALGPGVAFEYVGDARADLAIFREAAVSHLVNPSGSLLASAKRVANVGKVFDGDGRRLLPVVPRALRVHQWVKNLLLFLPVVLAHQTFEPVMLAVLFAFFAFSLVASGAYLVNDLLDLDADRKHPVNRRRPIASGRISLPEAIVLIILCFLIGFLIAGLLVPWPFAWILLLYAVLSIVYSLFLKHLLIIDVLVLAWFYSIRIIAGGAAAAIEISGWLLSFAIFFFLGLALLKRFVELAASRADGKPGSARAYGDEDLAFVGAFGIASGMLAVLVFVLYLNSTDVVALYSKPRLLWWVNLPLIYWTMRMWLNAARGRIQSDPILSAIKDPVSYVCAAAVSALLLLAIG